MNYFYHTKKILNIKSKKYYSKSRAIKNKITLNQKMSKDRILRSKNTKKIIQNKNSTKELIKKY